MSIAPSQRAPSVTWRPARRSVREVAASTFITTGRGSWKETALALSRGIPNGASRMHRFSHWNVRDALDGFARTELRRVETSCRRSYGTDVLFRVLTLFALNRAHALEELWRQATARPDFNRQDLSMAERARRLVNEGAIFEAFYSDRPFGEELKPWILLMELIQRAILLRDRKRAKVSGAFCGLKRALVSHAPSGQPPSAS